MAITINIDSQIKEYANLASFPATGVTKTIYIAKDTDISYYWDGSYIQLGSSVQDLQSVTDEGNSTNNSIVLYDDFRQLEISSQHILFKQPNNSLSQIKSDNTTHNLVFQLPNKNTGTYMLATTNDITDSQNLQNVTDEGNITTNDIVVKNNSGAIISENTDESKSTAITPTQFQIYTGTAYGQLRADNITENDVTLQFPQKAEGIYTIATIDDITDSQDLQNVTNNGATTTNSITVDSTNYFSIIEPSDIGTQNKDTGAYTYIGANGAIGIKTSANGEGSIQTSNITNNVTLEFPNKPVGTYTIATTEDTSTQVQSDWTQTDNTQVDYIKNKPSALTASGYYLAIQDSTTQNNPTANIPRAVKFDTIDLANGFSLQSQTAIFTGTINNGGAGAGTTLTVTSITSGTLKVGMVLTGGSITAGTFISAFTSGTGGVGTYVVSVSQLKTSATYTGTMTSQIVCANAGVYNLQFSSQMDKTDSGVDYVDFWLRKNGVDVIGSAGVISLQGNSPAYMMAAWNYLLQLSSGDIIELYWASADINMSITSQPLQTSPYPHPSIASTILTITQQAGVMAETQLDRLHAFASPYDYNGHASQGSDTSAAVWTITRLTLASNGTTTKGVATGSWDNRASLTYV